MERKRWLKLSKIGLTHTSSCVSLVTTIWILVLRGTNQFFVKEHGKMFRLEDYLRLRIADGLRMVSTAKYDRRGLGGLHGCEIICFDHLFTHIIEADGRFDAKRYMSVEDRNSYDKFLDEYLYPHNK